MGGYDQVQSMGLKLLGKLCLGYLKRVCVCVCAVCVVAGRLSRFSRKRAGGGPKGCALPNDCDLLCHFRPCLRAVAVPLSRALA